MDKVNLPQFCLVAKKLSATYDTRECAAADSKADFLVCRPHYEGAGFATNPPVYRPVHN